MLACALEVGNRTPRLTLQTPDEDEKIAPLVRGLDQSSMSLVVPGVPVLDAGSVSLEDDRGERMMVCELVLELDSIAGGTSSKGEIGAD